MSVQKDIAKKSALLKAERKSKRTVAVFGTVMFLVIVFALMVPGFGLTRGKLICGLEEHKHGSECYEQTLVCTQEEGESHKHNISCYEFKLICDKPVHTHSDSCYEAIDDSTDEQKSDEGAKGADSSGESSASSDSEPDAKSDASDESSSSSASADAASAGSDSSASADDAPSQTNDASDTSVDPVGSAEADGVVSDSGNNPTHPAQSFEAELKNAKDEVTLAVKIEAPEGALPVGTTLEVASVKPTKIEDAVDEAVAKKTNGKVTQIQAADITFKDADGNEIEPAVEITVTMTSALIADNEKPLVVHVDDEGKADVVDTLTKKELEKRDIKPAEDELHFDTEKFSIYGIVITTLEETLEASDGTSYTITVDAPASAGIPADATLQVEELQEPGRAWSGYVGKIEEEFDAKASYARLFDITILDADGAEIQPSDDVEVRIALNDLQDAASKGSTDTVDTNNIANGASQDDATESTAEQSAETAEVSASASQNTPAQSGVHAFHFSDDGGFNALDAVVSDDAVTFQTSSFSVYGVVTLEYNAEAPNDPYGLNGKSYGILNNQNTVSGTALTTSPKDNNTKLAGKTLTVRVDPVEREGNVFVANNSNIAMWTFYSVDDGAYNITAEVNGAIKYLKIGDDGVSLVDFDQSESPDCRIHITQGTGQYAGKYKFSTESKALKLDGGNFSITNPGTTNNANVWMNFAELSNLNEDDFVTYIATKVSVSGTVDDGGTIHYDVKNGDAVIVYTRIWNDETKRYEYYAIDHDGKLVRAYESGDMISWVGTRVNTMLWDFTEYYNDDGSPNYYYELQNQYSEKYIAPQMGSSDFLSDNKIGINLNGRRYNEYYSTILAWDDPYYDYASLMPQNGKLISVPMSKAADFYFAVMTPAETSDELTTVATIDHKPFGITVKMQDYERINSKNRSQDQVDVLGDTQYYQWTGSPGLLKKNLEADGFPMVAEKNHTSHSLSELYDEALEVNQQFLLSTYNETGYFEYDSTQNFAHLITSEADPWYGKPNKSGGTYGVGDFVVYDQLGTTSEKNKDTLKHGQFLPYNDLDVTKISKQYTNERDIHAEPLSSLDPRKGEKLYEITQKQGGTAPNYADHFFGVEMSASFMQSESGLDAWGHDLIFEFSGDDDFWLYVDGMLVLDLGGIHSALDGSVNFRTGKVVVNKRNTDLRTLYKEAYREKNPSASDDEVNNWLNGIFVDDGTNTGTVFKDYSGHTMRMFYMERGAGASNLHMRFNLAPYHDGEVQLEKEVSGTDNISYTNVRFPFQIFYENDNHIMVQADNSTPVTDATTGEPVEYKDSYTAGGKTYSKVFLLKAGQTVTVKLPNENTKYYFKECGLDSSTYDAVHINRSESELNPTDETASNQYKDYQIAETTVENRKKVIFDNHVKSDALKNLRIIKKVWADDRKTVPWNDDTTPFRFRISIGKDANGNYTTYSFGEYRVKDPQGKYCYYENGKFVSSDKAEFSELKTEPLPGEFKSEQEKATFYASPYGAVDNIPPYYTIEIPGLMDGTPFLVEERANETPAGYQLIDYELTYGDSVIANGNNGIISTSQDDPLVTVNNRHGYGLVVKKVWADADFMSSHDPIYFAVYLKGGTGSEPTLVGGSVRQVAHPNTSYTWFFEKLEEGKTLNDYLVYEVKLAVPEGGALIIGENGEVSGYKGDPVRIEEGGTLSVHGTSNDHGYSQTFDYTSSYSRETLTQEQIDSNVNFRTDTVTNSRPGVKIVKTDMGNPGNPLENAVFTLERIGSGDGSESGDGTGGADGGDNVGEAGGDDGTSGTGESLKKTFTSDENGLVAVAYLQSGVEYRLTEVASPKAHQSLIEPLTIKVEGSGANNDYTVYVNGDTGDHAQGYYTVNQVFNPTVTDMPTITVKNKPYRFQAVKVDAVTNAPIAGAKFDLYKQRYDSSTGDPMPDYSPMNGFTDLVTNNEGVISRINVDDLNPGSYYLRETEAPSGYLSLSGDVHFTIGAKGAIKVEADTSSDMAVASQEEASDGATVFTLTIKDNPKKTLRILKKAQDDAAGVLTGAEFALYAANQVENGKPKEGAEPVASGATDEGGLLDFERLDSGVYYLFETKAPDGYNLINEPVVITVTSKAITAKQGNENLTVKRITKPIEVWQITLYNTPGSELPETGGTGTGVFYLIGALLMAGAGIALFRLRFRSSE